MFSAIDCLVRSLALKEDELAWGNLGARLGPEEEITLAGRQYSRDDCRQRARELGSNDEDSEDDDDEEGG